MLEYLIIHYNCVTVVRMEHISDIKFQPKQFHLENYFTQQKQENNCQNLG